LIPQKLHFINLASHAKLEFAPCFILLTEWICRDKEVFEEKVRLISLHVFAPIIRYRAIIDTCWLEETLFIKFFILPSGVIADDF
jgi:hypothetical protein